MHLRIMCILLLLGKKFCVCLLGTLVYSIIQVCLLILCLNALPIIENETLISTIISSPFRSINICFIYVGILMLGTYTLITYIFCFGLVVF
jgi:hypothetical protein